MSNFSQATHVTDAWDGAASPGVCPESTTASGHSPPSWPIHVSSELANPLTSGPDAKLPLQGSAGCALRGLLKGKETPES